MSQLAIFTAPKPFTNPHIRTIQRNAIRSWKALGDAVEVWLVGDEDGVAQTAIEFGVGFIPDVQRNSSGTPRIDSIFNMVRGKSDAPFICYVNADILLFPDLLQTLQRVSGDYERFLLIGQRWDASITTELAIKPGWHEQFVPEAMKKAVLHTAVGSDYFVFPRNEYKDIPAFAVGRAGWDNWMIYKGRVEQIAVIDATSAITVIHQNHDFSHFPDGKIHRMQPETMENLDLAGGRHTVYSLYDASHKIVNGIVQRIRLNRWKLMREISIFPSVTLHWPWLARITYVLFNPRRAARDWRQDGELRRAAKEALNEKRSESN